LSLHATKAFGCGEGGAVVTTDTQLATRVFEALNFGFQGSRHSAVEGLNGKMSEYTAAVALAELDGWEHKHAQFATLVRRYRQEWAALGIPNRLWGAPDISCAYVLLECRSAQQTRAVSASLAAEGIDTRLWYGAGLAEHGIYRHAEHLRLQDGAVLDPLTLLGLPVAPDLGEEQVRRVCSAVGRALR
jgi:dTDP-4-amino-4,6-dideoxygalactose transaminase